MLKIRLSQIGKPGQRSYRIRVMDSRLKRDSGRYLDDLGYWNKIRKEYKLDKEKYEVWLKKGAQPTDGFKNIFKETAIWNKLLLSQKLIEGLKNLPENKIEISLPNSNFKPSKIQGLDWELVNFSALDLKNKLKENNYQLIKKELLGSWTKEEEESMKQIFKELKIETILSRRSNDGKVAVIKDHDELPLLLSPFNFEFSFASSKKTYSTEQGPVRIIEPDKERSEEN